MQGMIIKAVETKNDLLQQHEKLEEESEELIGTLLFDDLINKFDEELCDCLEVLFTMWNIKHGSLDGLCDYWNNTHNAKMESRGWKERV